MSERRPPSMELSWETLSKLDDEPGTTRELLCRTIRELCEAQDAAIVERDAALAEVERLRMLEALARAGHVAHWGGFRNEASDFTDALSELLADWDSQPSPVPT